METLHNMSKQSVLELEPDVQSIAFSDSDRLLIFIMEGGILSTICVTGFVLNLLTLIVLILERKDFTFEQQCLAFFDMMFLALAFLTLGLPNVSYWFGRHIASRVNRIGLCSSCPNTIDRLCSWTSSTLCSAYSTRFAWVRFASQSA